MTELLPDEGEIVQIVWKFNGKNWSEVVLHHSGGKFSPWTDEADGYDTDVQSPHPSHWRRILFPEAL